MREQFGPGADSWPIELPVPQGDGPRSALRVVGGHPRHLGAHLERLLEGAKALGDQVPWLAPLGPGLSDWVASNCPHEAALRLELHLDLGLLSARLEPLPALPPIYRLAPMPHPLGDPRSGILSKHKGLSGPWRRAALSEARRRGAEDALLVWPDGTLAETAIAAVALQSGVTLRLPPEEGRVASLAERLEIPPWCEARNLTRQQGPILLEDALLEELWCLNALRGIWPATIL